MADKEKKSIFDIFKKEQEKKEEPKKVVKPTAGIKTTPVKKTTAKAGFGKSDKPSSKMKDKATVDAFLKKGEAVADFEAKKQAEFLHTKTHQDLINAAYKAAEELKIAPWVLLRAAEWGHFTDDRGKKYDGPAIDEIKTLEPAQKAALKKALDIK